MGREAGGVKGDREGAADPSLMEAAVVGGVLGFEGALELVRPVRARMFSNQAHRLIFRAVRALEGRGVPVDPLTVADELGDRLDEAGGVVYLASLLDAVPTAANIRYHASRVVESHYRRRIAEAATGEGGPEKLQALIEARRDVLARLDPSEVLAGIRTWAEMQREPPLTYLVDDLLPEGGVSLVVGHPKAGKSTLARVLAAEVSGHGHGAFLGRALVNAGRVLYYAPDEHPSMTAAGLRGILPHDADGVDFIGSANLETLAVAAPEYRLLIVDTLGRLFARERFPDSDAYMQWQAHLDRVRRVATDTGCAIVLLHHARKSGGTRSLAVSGSAAIAGAADTVITLDVAEEDGQPVRYVESINRAGMEIPRQRLVLAGDGWLTVQAPRVDPSKEARAEARAMKRDGVPVRQIADDLGVSRSTVGRWTKGVSRASHG